MSDVGLADVLRGSIIVKVEAGPREVETALVKAGNLVLGVERVNNGGQLKESGDTHSVEARNNSPERLNVLPTKT